MKYEQYKQDVIESTKRLIKIPSVYDETTVTESTPFGRAINDCLETTLALCDDLGFRTYKDELGYYGYAEIGEGPSYLGVICHLDVVPAGDRSKWDTPPFQVVVKEGAIYGRGTGDDKGPTVAAIYAVKAILDEGHLLNKRIRLIFGTDEETLWRGIEQYKANEEEPEFAIAADGYFPLTYAEKGLLQLNLIKAKEPNDIVFNGGENYNSVASNAIYEGPLKLQFETMIDPDEIEHTVNQNRLEIIGVPSHASRPDIGQNAVLYMAKLMYELGNRDAHVKLLNEVFHYEYDQMNVFETKIEDHTGPISINIGAIDMSSDILIKLDMRLPVTYEKDDIIEQVKKRVEPYGFSVEFRSYLDSLFVSLESPYVKALLETYQTISGDTESKPIINGGATFARAYPTKAVCYGVKFKGKPSMAHEPNERIDIESLIKGIEIYKEALLKLEAI